MNHKELIGRDDNSEMELTCHLNLLGLVDDDGKGPTSQVYIYRYVFIY